MKSDVEQYIESQDINIVRDIIRVSNNENKLPKEAIWVGLGNTSSLSTLFPVIFDSYIEDDYSWTETFQRARYYLNEYADSTLCVPSYRGGADEQKSVTPKYNIYTYHKDSISDIGGQSVRTISDLSSCLYDSYRDDDSRFNIAVEVVENRDTISLFFEFDAPIGRFDVSIPIVDSDQTGLQVKCQKIIRIPIIIMHQGDALDPPGARPKPTICIVRGFSPS